MKQTNQLFRQNLPPRSVRHAAKLLAIVIFLGTTLTAAISQAAQFYISPTGSDSHPCSQALPCLTLQHAVSVASSGDTINIEPGTYAKTITSIDSKNLSIVGAGASRTILEGLGRGGVTAVIQIFFSFVRVSGVTITEGGASAIEMEGGSLILEDSVVSDSFGAPGSPLTYAGGISNLSGVLTVKGTTITNNNFEGESGGGIANVGGVTTISQSTISGNSAGSGGGIANLPGGNNFGGLITLGQSTISGNSASTGGGIWNGGQGTVQILNSTIAGNTASANGGGIEADGGVLELNNTTIAENVADAGLSGGTGGGLNLSSSATLIASNTILALNLRKFSRFPFVAPNDCGVGQLVSFGYNLMGFLGKCSLVGPGSDRTGVNPNLGPLQNNGGPTETMLPLTGSPVIDAGNPAGCTDPFGNKLTVDQRGLSRPDADDVRCDIGAVESQQ